METRDQKPRPVSVWWLRHRPYPGNPSLVQATLVYAPPGVRPWCSAGWELSEFASGDLARAYLPLLPLECGAERVIAPVPERSHEWDALDSTFAQIGVSLNAAFAQAAPAISQMAAAMAKVGQQITEAAKTSR